MRVLRNFSSAPFPRAYDAIVSRTHSATSCLCRTRCSAAPVLSRTHSSAAAIHASGTRTIFRPALHLHGYGAADSGNSHRSASLHGQHLFTGSGHASSASALSSRHRMHSPLHGTHYTRCLSTSDDSSESHLLRLRALTEEQVEELVKDEEMQRALAVVNKKVLAASLEHLPDSVYEPTRKQYMLYYREAFIPFMFFGFLDNSIMLLFGDFFDFHLGMMFGITTLTAAALGNVVGDCTGIWLTGTIEAVAGHLRLQDHGLTFEQRRLTKSQTIKTVGMTSGIFIGCILGMFPLIWPEEWRLWSARDEIHRRSSTSEAESADATTNP
eukprot:GEMP01024704.1.p1 GENE.GEMP01024704.1~~GEMP01024704.1.p1  ORF type:complete len:359 (+),score=60.39 GEMP01024704.1:102-1079(+)